MLRELLVEFTYTPFIECPNCKRLLEHNLKRCPDCYEEIVEDYAALSAAVVAVNTYACSVTKMIESLNPFALIILVLSAYMYIMDAYVSDLPFLLYYMVLPSSVLPPLIILLWFYRFGRFDFGDEEYVKAKREMWASLRLWLTILVVQFIALATLRL